MESFRFGGYSYSCSTRAGTFLCSPDALDQIQPTISCHCFGARFASNAVCRQSTDCYRRQQVAIDPHQPNHRIDAGTILAPLGAEGASAIHVKDAAGQELIVRRGYGITTRITRPTS